MNFWTHLVDQASGIGIGMVIGYILGYFDAEIHKTRKRGHDDT